MNLLYICTVGLLINALKCKSDSLYTFLKMIRCILTRTLGCCNSQQMKLFATGLLDLITGVNFRIHRGSGSAYRIGGLFVNNLSADNFPLGARVRKIKGSSWQGTVCGHYSTKLTPNGVCVESEREPGSVQIYPAHALERMSSPISDTVRHRVG